MPLILAPKGANIFECDAEAIVSPCNCLNVDGAGLAKLIARRIPHEIPLRSPLPGQAVLVQARAQYRYVIRAYTKDHWRDPARLLWAGWCFKEIATLAYAHGLVSVAVPALGCGLGGLAWDDVLAKAKGLLRSENTTFTLFPPLEE